MSDYYSRSGEPLSYDEYIKLCTPENKRVAVETLDDGTWISTVWLGLDHSHWGGAPLIFETMIFGGPLDQECERYHSESAALAGHARMVARAKSPQVEEEE